MDDWKLKIRPVVRLERPTKRFVDFVILTCAICILQSINQSIKNTYLQCHMSQAVSDHSHAIEWLSTFILLIHYWTPSKWLKLNNNNTHVICRSWRSPKLTFLSLLSAVDLFDAYTCLCVTIAFTDHIRILSGCCFHSLQQSHSIGRILTTDTIITVVNAVVLVSQIDYCNAVLAVCRHIWCPLEAVPWSS